MLTDVLSNTIGTKKNIDIKTKMFIFVDYSIEEEYSEFIDNIMNNNRFKIVEQINNFDMNGTLTRIVVYQEIL